MVFSILLQYVAYLATFFAQGKSSTFPFSLCLLVFVVFSKAEKARLEPDFIKGNLQSTCYACRFFGMMVAAPLSTVLYNSRYGPKSIVLALGISPILVLPCIIFLKETKVIEVKTVRDRMQDMWITVQSRSVWQPMAFVSTCTCTVHYYYY